VSDLSISLKFGLKPDDVTGVRAEMFVGQGQKLGHLATEVTLTIPSVDSGRVEEALSAKADIVRVGLRTHKPVRRSEQEIRRVRFDGALYAPVTSFIGGRGGHAHHAVAEGLVERVRALGLYDVSVDYLDKIGSKRESTIDLRRGGRWAAAAAIDAEFGCRLSDLVDPTVDDWTERVAQALKDEARKTLICVDGQVYQRQPPPAICVSLAGNPLSPDSRMVKRGIPTLCSGPGFSYDYLSDSLLPSPDFSFSITNFDAARAFLDRFANVDVDGGKWVEQRVAALHVDLADGDDILIDEPAHNAEAGLRMVLDAVKCDAHAFSGDAFAACASLYRAAASCRAGETDPAELVEAAKDLASRRFLLPNITAGPARRLPRAILAMEAAIACSQPKPDCRVQGFRR